MSYSFKTLIICFITVNTVLACGENNNAKEVMIEGRYQLSFNATGNGSTRCTANSFVGTIKNDHDSIYFLTIAEGEKAGEVAAALTLIDKTDLEKPLDTPSFPECGSVVSSKWSLHRESVYVKKWSGTLIVGDYDSCRGFTSECEYNVSMERIGNL